MALASWFSIVDIASFIRVANEHSFLRVMYNLSFCSFPVLAGALLIVSNATHAIAVDEATFSAPEIHRGLWPFMVMAGLFRVMPKRAGLDFIMRGKPIDSKKAKDWGLINKSVKKEELNTTSLRESEIESFIKKHAVDAKVQ